MQHWYLGPILDFSSSYAETIYKIRCYIETNEIKKIALMGSSMGGFAAMNIGASFSADLVLSFAPQTCLTKEWRENNFEPRYPAKMAEIHEIQYERQDIAESYAASHPNQTLVFFDPEYEDDKRHAAHIANLPNVEIVEAQGGHHVAYPLAQSGEITRILERFVQDEKKA